MPERFADRVPPFIVELGVGIGAALLFFAFRMALNPIAGDRAPYALVFLSVVIACVVAGWRSGLVALILGQWLTWALISGPAIARAPTANPPLGGLFIATLSQLVLLVTLALYQREVGKGLAERERRLALLDEALREIDHRTRNNYQTVLAMIELQARRSSDENVGGALRQVADRIQAIANASQQLAVNSTGLDEVRLDDHLCSLVRQIERGLSRDGIELDCEVDDVTASPDAATSISIIVNELVTNAIKHAFNGERPGKVSVTGRTGAAFELIVADNGKGIAATRRDGVNGLGTKLVESFARQLSAQHEIVSTDRGTTHRLVIPRLD